MQGSQKRSENHFGSSNDNDFYSIKSETISNNTTPINNK